MSSSGSLRYLFVAIALAAAGSTARATEPAGSGSPEKALAAKLNCADFSKNSDQTWTAHANTKIDGRDFGGETFGIHGMMIKNADVATALNQKCGH
jgi:hypothetical protein